MLVWCDVADGGHDRHEHAKRHDGGLRGVVVKCLADALSVVHIRVYKVNLMSMQSIHMVMCDTRVTCRLVCELLN